MFIPSSSEEFLHTFQSSSTNCLGLLNKDKKWIKIILGCTKVG
ncbi:hypothetical protein E1A91_A05G286200v1 [Gossypium mustelinum]|uniref:Uncharacterized protein n=1 Tax=Gossypium mustelinum TaxID=34275 RepID=A0A5D2ZBP1_GOSMU|nr:hypothetical protein E1A91_A05G286200v1 [Gossypium mustelinum]